MKIIKGKTTKRVWTTPSGKRREAWGFSFYHPYTGKQVKKTGYHSQSDAQAAMDSLKAQILSGKDGVDFKIKFQTLSQQYLDGHCKVYCKESTRASYESCIKKINKFFGDTKAVDVNHQLLISYIESLQDDKKSNKTINNNIVLLKSIFNFAVSSGILLKNPTERIKKLPNKQKEMSFLNKEEVSEILEQCKELFPSYYPLLYTAIFTGVRRGELLALTWRDIDFRNRKVNIDKSVYKNKVIDPKTQTSIRKIDMTEGLFNVLKQHKDKRDKTTTLVFHNREGKYLDPDNMIERFFKKLTEECGFYSLRFHDLRHTYVSLLIAAENVPIKYIQEQAGHSSIQVTMDRYGHLLPDVNKKAVSALDAMFSSKEKNENKLRTCGTKKRHLRVV